MLEDGTRIQLDLSETLKAEKILLGKTELKYERDSGAVFVDFPKTLKKGRTYAVDFYYSGFPVCKRQVRRNHLQKDGAGKDWITTSCEDDGASIWWPNKDQWRDEVKDMEIDVAVPDGPMGCVEWKVRWQKRTRRRIYTVEVESALSNQQLRCGAEYRELRSLWRQA